MLLLLDLQEELGKVFVGSVIAAVRSHCGHDEALNLLKFRKSS